MFYPIIRNSEIFLHGEVIEIIIVNAFVEQQFSNIYARTSLTYCLLSTLLQVEKNSYHQHNVFILEIFLC